ncbi:MAG: FtsX-like permease family protein [Lachnospiraceae bacterium]|nr:FtsX-like permease family protein [Lachnospiraceae bacterium]
MTEYFRAVWKNIVLAYKSVRYHLKQYLCFFLAVFAVQVFFGIVLFSKECSESLEYRYVTEAYDSHLILNGLNEKQYNVMLNGKFSTLLKKAAVHEIVGTGEREEAGETVYDVRVLLTGKKVSKSYQTFLTRYFEPLSAAGEVSITETPLYTYAESKLESTKIATREILLLTALSAILLTALYGIRTGHYQFDYGIYRSFGADFRVLTKTSFWEMAIVVTATWLPASLLSCLSVLLICLIRGYRASFSLVPVLWILLLSLAVALIAVLLPMRRLASLPPLKLLSAADNSNEVVSPRTSFNLRKKKKVFPRKYALYSVFRFRKYYLRLSLLTALCAVAFLCFWREAEYDDELVRTPVQDFEIAFSSYSDEYEEEILSMNDKLDRIVKPNAALEVKAPDLLSHALFPKSESAFFNDFLDYVSEDYGKTRATMMVSYYPADAKIISQLKEQGKVTGNPEEILTDPSKVIVSDSVNNRKVLDLKPGDKVYIAETVTPPSEQLPFMEAGNELLRQMLDVTGFRYHEYTVAAVVSDMPTGTFLPIYFADGEYTARTGKNVHYTKINAYLKPGLTALERDTAESDLRDWMAYYQADVSALHSQEKAAIRGFRSTGARMRLIGTILLLGAPLFWFFAGGLFERKRKGEITVLRSLGASRSELHGLAATEGTVTAIVGTLIALLLSLLSMFVFWFVISKLAAVSGYLARPYFEVPVLPLLLALAVQAASAFYGNYLPAKKLLTELGEEEDNALNETSEPVSDSGKE